MIKSSKQSTIQTIKNHKGGKGEVQINHILEGDQLKGTSKLFARVVLGKGVSIGLHEHKDDYEVYYILKGLGMVTENDSNSIVGPGDVIYTADGNFHAVENIGEGNLEFIALIVAENF